jgi:CRISPR type IV-associated protein Csf1
LVNPPEPPFTIAIAESGQKHILPWAREAQSRDYFPVQFELDSLWVQRSQWLDLLQAFEELMGMGFSKTEIVSGEYRPDRLMPVLSSYQQWDGIVQAWRGTRLIDLASYVATTEE